MKFNNYKNTLNIIFILLVILFIYLFFFSNILNLTFFPKKRNLYIESMKTINTSLSTDK